jgi:chemotaxis protein MotA
VDPVTLLAILTALAILLVTIALGGNLLIFFNLPGLILVVGGTFAVTLAMVSLRHFIHSFRVAAQVLSHTDASSPELIEHIVELARIARHDGLLALEDEEIGNAFLKRGIQMSIDGQPPELIRARLSNDINLSLQRHEIGQRMFRSIADVAPAMGMIGTLIGLVQMLAQMDDPKSIGPAMAVALLTTLYGAVIAHAIALPIAEKLALRSEAEAMQKGMILEGLDGIQTQMSPILLRQMLMSYLPEYGRIDPSLPNRR